MEDTSSPRRETPDGHQDYDVTRMREDDFERLAVYIVPDMPCERGTPSRAEKTLPRSLTLKPSLALSTPNVKVNIYDNHNYGMKLWANLILNEVSECPCNTKHITNLLYDYSILTNVLVCRLKVCGVRVLYRGEHVLVRSKVCPHPTIPATKIHGDTFGGYVSYSSE